MAHWLGIDVGAARKGFDAALIDETRLVSLHRAMSVADVRTLAQASRPVLIAVDSPRRPAPDGHTARADELALNRSVCGIRWTPDQAHLAGNPYYAWIEAGLALYADLIEHGHEPIEVFPTAAWTRWIGRRGGRPRADWSRAGLARLGLPGVPPRTSQDARDAIAAAVTARLHTAGQTDRFGEIVVPRNGL
jgi:predicted nuclease with RNAse H fold